MTASSRIGEDRRRRIVVVEDNVDGAYTLAQFLQLHAFDVRIAHDCKDGLEAIRAHRPHVVFSDIGLPGSSGLDLAMAVRRELGNELFLVAVTARSNREACLEAGFNAHVMKPADPFELVRLASSVGETGFVAQPSPLTDGDAPVPEPG